MNPVNPRENIFYQKTRKLYMKNIAKMPKGRKKLKNVKEYTSNQKTDPYIVYT